ESDAAVLVLELGGRVERRGRGVARVGDRRVQPAAGDDQQRKAGAAGILVIDPDIAFFVKRHFAFPFVGRVERSATRHCSAFAGLPAAPPRFTRPTNLDRYWAAAASGCAATAGRLFLRKPRTCRSAS